MTKEQRLLNRTKLFLMRLVRNADKHGHAMSEQAMRDYDMAKRLIKDIKSHN